MECLRQEIAPTKETKEFLDRFPRATGQVPETNQKSLDQDYNLVNWFLFKLIEIFQSAPFGKLSAL